MRLQTTMLVQQTRNKVMNHSTTRNVPTWTLQESACVYLNTVCRKKTSFLNYSLKCNRPRTQSSMFFKAKGIKSRRFLVKISPLCSSLASSSGRHSKTSAEVQHHSMLCALEGQNSLNMKQNCLCLLNHAVNYSRCSCSY